MIILGITGGSGVGKTTVSNIFRNNGIDVIDTDIVAREIVKPSMPALSEIRDYFGVEFINPDGTLNRKKLAGVVFNDPEKLKILNKITHKYISEYVTSYIKEYKKDIIGIDGAALIESGINNMCDYVISVLADKKIRIERIKIRDNLSELEAKNRISSQKSDDFYIENSDFLVYNNGKDINDLEHEIKNIILNLRRRAWKKEEENTDRDHYYFYC